MNNEIINKLDFHKGMRCLLLCGRPINGQRHEVYVKLVACGVKDAEKLYDKLVELDSPLYWGKSKADFVAEYNSYLGGESDDGDGLSASSRARRGE